MLQNMLSVEKKKLPRMKINDKIERNTEIMDLLN